MMPVPSRLEEAYSEARPAIEAVGRYVSSTIRPWCDRNDYLFSGRLKEVESLAEKIESGRYDRWSDLDDLYACRIVVPTAAHEDAVLTFLRRIFEEVELRARNSTKKAPDVFRFDSTRFIGKLRITDGLELPPGASSVRFEVQVPSAFEYAWAIVTHDLVYKSRDMDWRKARLAAQLKAAVEQIELIIAGFEANLDFVAQSSYPETDAKQEIIDAFQDLMNDETVSPALAPQSWSRFADNVYGLMRLSLRGNTAFRMNAIMAAIKGDLAVNGIARGIMGGSLFQVVLGCVSRGVVQGVSLASFPVVDSPELRDLYRVNSIPKEFSFDWSATEV
jgi:ppGpp synthetase/RelA/SpoT-type nucleotidyltranferase